MNPYFVYVVRCADQTLYTGICTDLTRRLNEHNSPTKGARYTRSRQPVVLLYSESAPDRSSALRREIAIKRLNRSQKEQLSN